MPGSRAPHKGRFFPVLVDLNRRRNLTPNTPLSTTFRGDFASGTPESECLDESYCIQELFTCPDGGPFVTMQDEVGAVFLLDRVIIAFEDHPSRQVDLYLVTPIDGVINVCGHPHDILIERPRFGNAFHVQIYSRLDRRVYNLHVVPNPFVVEFWITVNDGEFALVVDTFRMCSEERLCIVDSTGDVLVRRSVLCSRPEV